MKKQTGKIRMVSFLNGEIAFKKVIDLDKKTIKERNVDTQETIEYNLDGMIQSFGSIENYISYNMRVWDFRLLDSLN